MVKIKLQKKRLPTNKQIMKKIEEKDIEILKLRKQIEKLEKSQNDLFQKNNREYCSDCKKFYSDKECENKIEYCDPDGFSAPEFAIFCPKKHIVRSI